MEQKTCQFGMRAVHGTEDLPVFNEGRAWNRRPGSLE